MRAAPLIFLLAFACKKQPAKPVKSDVPLIQAVTVKQEGFVPSHIEVAPGQEMILRITRVEKETCADAIVIEGDPVKHMLPFDKTVDVKVKAPESGRLAFACPMKMYNGAIEVVR